MLPLLLALCLPAHAAPLDDALLWDLPEAEDAVVPDVDGVVAARLADALDDRTGSEAYVLGAALGRAVASGSEPDVDAAAIALLRWLHTADLAPVPLDPAGVAADRAGLLATRDVRVARAREHLRSGEYEAAITLLDPLRAVDDGELVAPLYEEAVDCLVRRERERVGRLFVESRGRPAAERLPVLWEVHGVLEGLLRTYPETIYAEPLSDNLARVEREIAMAEHG